MRNGSLLPASLILVLSLLTSSCADPPTKEMDQAQGAIDAARAAGGADYAADEFKAAEAALARSHQAVTDRDYRQALSYALDARDRAQTAARLSADEKARVRTEADRELRAAQEQVQRASERLEAATTAKVPEKALTGARATVDRARTSVETARAAFEGANYRAALATLSDAGLPAALDAAISQIDAAEAARSSRRGVRRNR